MNAHALFVVVAWQVPVEASHAGVADAACPLWLDSEKHPCRPSIEKANTAARKIVLHILHKPPFHFARFERADTKK
jgi:hypothetical protein